MDQELVSELARMAAADQRSRRPPNPMRAVAIALGAGVLGLAGCGGDGDEETRPSTAGEGLGQGAKVTTLARTQLAKRPSGPLAWVGDKLAPGRSSTHRHEVAFLYARRGTARLERLGKRRRLRAGQSASVPGGTPHRHLLAGRAAAALEVRLAEPGSPPPVGGRRLFESEPLQGIPARPLALFLEVTVPARGGMTTVHTHPGPEFIYQFEGRIDYQNALIGTKRLGPGGAEAIPPDTAVQKRNPFGTAARFLSWFLVDADKPFAPTAEF